MRGLAEPGKRALVGGTVILIIGIALLLAPVSIRADGEKVECGYGLFSNMYFSETHDIGRTGDTYARIFGDRSPRTSSGGAVSACRSSLTTRRIMAWPATVLGAGLMICGVVLIRRASPTTGSAPDSAGPHPTSVAHSQTPAASVPAQPPTDGAVVVPPGWYVSPDDPTMYQWFDGHRWTDAHAPRPSPQE